jgi:hypothetical protein
LTAAASLTSIRAARLYLMGRTVSSRALGITNSLAITGLALTITITITSPIALALASTIITITIIITIITIITISPY